jgi:hypothetical protein
MSVTTISLDQCTRGLPTLIRVVPRRYTTPSRAEILKKFERIVQDEVAHELPCEKEKRSRSHHPYYQPTYFCEAKS